MKRRSRRDILKASVLLPSGLIPTGLARGLTASTAQGAHQEADLEAARFEEALAALAPIVLPAEALGEEGVASQLERFRRWRDGFEPVAELDHPYLSSDEIRYGPPDPRPLWRAQCQALDDEARKRHGLGFAQLESSERERLLRRQLPPAARDNESEGLPDPTRAPHIAVALLAWFYATPDANDLCYEAAIGRHSCRGLPDAVLRPAPLEVQPLKPNP